MSLCTLWGSSLITLKKEQKKNPWNKRIVHKVLIFPKFKISLQPSDYSTTSSANFWNRSITAGKENLLDSSTLKTEKLFSWFSVYWIFHVFFCAEFPLFCLQASLRHTGGTLICVPCSGHPGAAAEAAEGAAEGTAAPHTETARPGWGHGGRAPKKVPVSSTWMLLCRAQWDCSENVNKWEQDPESWLWQWCQMPFCRAFFFPSVCLRGTGSIRMRCDPGSLSHHIPRMWIKY